MSIIEGLNKAFDNRVRIGIMSALVVNDSLDYNSIKELLGVTDGNLASHMKALEALAYVKVKKSFSGRKPKTTYFVTELGKLEFSEHLTNLEKLVKGEL